MNEKGKEESYAPYCFDIDDAYEWFIVRNGTHPTHRRPITNTERNELISKYNNLHSISLQFFIYHTQYNDKNAVAIYSSQTPNKWILLFKTIGRGGIQYEPPYIITPIGEHLENTQDYRSLFKDMVQPEKQLTGEALDGVMKYLKDSFHAMKNPRTLGNYRPRVVNVFKEILQWDDHANPISPTVATGGRRKNLTVKDLQARCRARGISYSGLRKAELVAALQPRR